MDVIKKNSYNPLCMRNEHNRATCVRGNRTVNTPVSNIYTRV